MPFPIHNLSFNDFPTGLKEIPQPPETLHYRGTLPPQEKKLLAVVGSRRFTNYGQEAVEYLLGGLARYDIGIISGLALGIDSLAHATALRHNLYTLAIPGGGLDDSVIYPARHKPLARQILESGGALLSEYEPTFRATHWSFPERNRLVCGIAHATLVIEAGEKSGSLITARLTVDYNRDLLVVPGSIFSENSRGTHQFLKLGAAAVTSPEDILTALFINPQIQETKPTIQTNETETLVLKLLTEPLSRDALIQKLALPTNEAASLLMEMEMKDLITESAGLYRRVI